jgi:thiosulfate/3-mercaptopyruvate sulfurtransferase
MLPARYDRLVVVTLVAADSLARAPERDRPHILDVRWTLGDPDAGRNAYRAGHIPGAAFVDLDAELAGPPGKGGRHPLPDPATLQDALRRAGVREGRPVVVYDAGGVQSNGAAARAWWTLRWAGIADVAVLDGGYAAWLAAGGPVESGEGSGPPGDVTVRPGGMPVLDAAGAAALARTGVLVDARVPPRFRGEVEPVDPVAGRIPGAVNVPAAETVDADGNLLPAAELRLRFEAAGVRDVAGAYCGSGVSAAQTVLALTVAGFQPVLYVGSWSDWITDPDRPVATGAA